MGVAILSTSCPISPLQKQFQSFHLAISKQTPVSLEQRFISIVLEKWLAIDLESHALRCVPYLAKQLACWGALLLSLAFQIHFQTII